MNTARPWLIGLVTLVIGLLIVVGLWRWLGSTMLRPAQTSPTQLADIQVGGQVSVVGEVTAIAGQTLQVEVLQGKDYGQRTGAMLKLERPGNENIVMGGEADVKPGAIAQFDGVKSGADAVRLERIVILTGFVQGPPPR